MKNMTDNHVPKNTNTKETESKINAQISTSRELAPATTRLQESVEGKVRIQIELPNADANELQLQTFLKGEVIGQDKAIDTIVTKLVEGFKSINDRPSPSVFFLSGPTGVGKTETVKALSKALFGKEDAFTRIDCNEYQQHHTVTNLFGAPKSFVGYKDQPALSVNNVEKHYRQAEKKGFLHPIIKNKKNFSIILFDEIEKAHPEVHQALLTLLDEGKINFSNGKKANYANSIIIMTSNIGQHQLKQEQANSIGFTKVKNESGDQKTIEKAMKKSFSPEFMGRVDEVIQYTNISQSDAKKIIQKQLDKTNGYLAVYYEEIPLSLQVSEAVIDYILRKGFTPEEGARGLGRTYEKEINANIGKLLHSKDFEQFFDLEIPLTIHVDIDKTENKLLFTVEYDKLDSERKRQLKENETALPLPALVETLNMEKGSELETLLINFELVQNYMEVYSMRNILIDFDDDLEYELMELEEELKKVGYTEKELKILRNGSLLKQMTNPEFLLTIHMLNPFSVNKNILFSPINERTIFTIVKLEHKKLKENTDYTIQSGDENLKYAICMQRCFDRIKYIIGAKKLNSEQQEKIIEMILKVESQTQK